MVLRLPRNDLKDMPSFHVCISPVKDHLILLGQKAQAHLKTVRFPNGLETLLERCEVRIQGPQVDGNSSQDTRFVANMLKSIRGDPDRRLEKNVSTRELIDIGFVSSGEENGFFSIEFFPVFVSECKP